MGSADPRGDVPAPLVVHVASGIGSPASGSTGAGDFYSALVAQTESFARLTQGPVGDADEATQVFVGGRIETGSLNRLPKLRAIVVPWSGIAPSMHRTLEEAARSDVRILNIHHNAPSAAETALGLLLAVSRGIPVLDRSLRSGDWRPRYQPKPSLRLAGTTATVLGRGAIGGRIARALRALDMQVRTLGRPERGERWSPKDLAAAVAGSRVLMLSLPDGPETEDLVDATVLDAVPGGILINVGRGSVVDESALYDRLLDGRLFGAGMDVWRQVPKDTDARASTLPSSLPFHELEQVVMTPHVGGGLGESGIDLARAASVAAVLESIHHASA